MTQESTATTMPRGRLPFVLPRRPPVRSLRNARDEKLSGRKPKHRQSMTGFEKRFTDIVDYIVRITDEIWLERAVGYIYDTYDTSCTVYSPYGIVRTVEEVIASTTVSLNASPDGAIEHLNVAWAGNDRDGFYTSHLGRGRSTNLGASTWGPATGRSTTVHFAADCISQNNRIHTEWLVRDNGAAVRQLGYDPHEVAQRIANTETLEHYVLSPENRLVGQVPRTQLDLDSTTVDGWARALLHDSWNLRRLDWLTRSHAEDLSFYAGGGRTGSGLREYQSLILHILAAVPDGVIRVENVCWSEEADGVIVAVRWVLEGTSAPGGFLGDCPRGRPLSLMAISHLRLSAGKVVEEWMLFDEIAALAQAYRR